MEQQNNSIGGGNGIAPGAGEPKRLVCTLGGYTFVARKTDEAHCEIISVSAAPLPDGVQTARRVNDAVVLDFAAEMLAEQQEMLRVPGEICGLITESIMAGSTETLSADPSVIVFPETFREIGQDCFVNLPSLEAVFLGGVQKIGKNCFSLAEETRYRATERPALYVYTNGTPECGADVFKRSVSVDEYEEYLDWGEMYTGSHTVKYTTEWRPAAPVTEIENGILKRMVSFAQEIAVPDGVTAIARHAFLGCPNVRRVTLPESLSYIGSEAFCGCDGLVCVENLERVETVEKKALYGCLLMPEQYRRSI